MSKSFTAIGLMSGTSMDGVDAAMIKTDGEGHVQTTGHNHFRPYSRDEQRIVAEAIEKITTAFDLFEQNGGFDDTARQQLPQKQLSKLRHAMKRSEEMIVAVHEQAVVELLEKSGTKRDKIDLVGFHGQTVLHRPERQVSVQLGEAELLAERLKMLVVGDLRQADIKAGGQGAPLVPVYHRALVKQAGLELPVAVVNIGGVANVTYIGADGELVAFDTGPGNALINDWVARHGAGEMDRDGLFAASGKLKESVLSELLDNPYFQQEPPKSLDRNHFSLTPLAGMSLEWGAATLTAFTALSVARADFFFPAPPRQWIICGGGAHNPALMKEFDKRLDGEVVTADEMGWSSDFMEAEAFAYLAVRSLKGLPLTFPRTTGVPRPLTGGVLYQPQGGSTTGFLEPS